MDPQKLNGTIQQKKRNFLIQIQPADYDSKSLIFNHNGFLTYVSSSMFTWAKATWECTHLREHIRPLSKHGSDVAHLSPARPPHMHDLYKSGHHDNSDTRKTSEDLDKFKVTKGKQTLEKSCKVNQLTIEDLWNVLASRSFWKRQESLCCLPSFVMLQSCLGPMLALHHVLFKEGLVCSRLHWEVCETWNSLRL